MMNSPEASNPAAPFQRNWRFVHDGNTALARMSAYEIRARLKDHLPDAPHLSLAVRTGEHSVLVSPLDAEANQWLADHETTLMGVIAEVAGEVIPLRPEFQDITFGPEPATLYIIPELIVAKKGDWSPWREASLPPDRIETMQQTIRDGLKKALSGWNLPDNGSELIDSVRIIKEGKAMPIVNGNGPRGMARLRVQFIAPFKIEGNLFVGGFPMLGHGKVIRGGLVHG